MEENSVYILRGNMKFTKMQSFGNDYVYIELLTQEMKEPSRYAKFLSKQHFGVGSDGMILICPSDKADFRMRVFNLIGVIVFAVYGCLIPAYSTIILNICLIIVNTFHLVILLKQKKKETNQTQQK